MLGWKGWSYFSRFSTVRVLCIPLQSLFFKRKIFQKLIIFFGKLIWGSNRSALLLTNIKTQNTVFLSWPFQIGHNLRFRLNHSVFIPPLICTDRTNTTVKTLEIFLREFFARNEDGPYVIIYFHIDSSMFWHKSKCSRLPEKYS